jgi:hypothetical protein
MRTRPFFLATCLLLTAILGSPRTAVTAPPPGQPPDPADTGPPRVALLATAKGAEHTSLYHASAATGGLSAPLASFTHLPGAVVRGAVLPGSEVVMATADTAETRDLSFAASLFRLAPHAPPERLCDGVVHASRPLVTAAGRVFVSRGTAGPDGEGPALRTRVDALSIDEVDPWTGHLRTVHGVAGHLAFLAGAHGAEVIVYRVSPDGADLVGIDPETAAVRTIVPRLPPFARDFSVDHAAGALLFRGRHEADPRTWTIERVDLASGAVSRLHQGPDMNLAPHAWPGGAVAYNPEGHTGLALLGGGGAARGLPAGGVDWVISITEDGLWAAGQHTVQGALPRPFALDVAAGRGVLLDAPAGARVAVAGLVPAEGGAP